MAKARPVWDGLAKAKGHNGEEIILLVEAKGHLSEMKSELRATSSESRGVIQNTFQKFRQKMELMKSTQVFGRIPTIN